MYILLLFRMGVTLHGSGHGHSHGLGGGHTHSHGNNSSSYDHNHSHGHSHSGSINDGDRSSDTDGLVTGEKSKSKLKKDLNVRAAFIHVIGDLVQSVGVFIAALVIYFKVDLLICIFISFLFLRFTLFLVHLYY